jgi:hypothetical protein
VGRPFSRRSAVFGPVNGPALDVQLSAERTRQTADVLQGFAKLGPDRRISPCRAVHARPVPAGKKLGAQAIIDSHEPTVGIGSRISWSSSAPQSRTVRSRADEEALRAHQLFSPWLLLHDPYAAPRPIPRAARRTAGETSADLRIRAAAVMGLRPDPGGVLAPALPVDVVSRCG